MVTKTKVRAQVHMDDVVINNDGLLQMLEEREEKKKAASEYKSVDKEVKDKINSLDTPLPFRLGRFIITRAPVSAKSVSFETAQGTRINIKLLGE